VKLSKEAFKRGRLAARPTAANPPGTTQLSPGVHIVATNRKRDTLLYVPSRYSNGDSPASLAVMLHGAGGDAEHGLSLLRWLAEANNLIILAPVSTYGSWDIITAQHFGPDVAIIDHALTNVFEQFSINVSHVAIGGFSDGASYALCLGLINGDLFTHVIAFSPGFFYSPETFGKPPVFISHGTYDTVLPIDPCSRKIVPRLQKQGYKVSYNEFEGGHVIPAEIATASMQWFNPKQ
jgi:predicted esterase